MGGWGWPGAVGALAIDSAHAMLEAAIELTGDPGKTPLEFRRELQQGRERGS
jgi:hypothetical protein